MSNGLRAQLPIQKLFFLCCFITLITLYISYIEIDNYELVYFCENKVSFFFSLSASGKPPTFTEPLQPVTAVEGSKLTLRCVVTGSPVLDIKWYREGRELRPTRDFKPSYDIQTGEATLTIPEVFPDDHGTYSCTAVNKFGKDATTAMLTVKGNFIIIIGFLSPG